MYWSNGTFNFSCLVTFEFFIQEDKSSPIRNWVLYPVNKGMCKTRLYTMEINE